MDKKQFYTSLISDLSSEKWDVLDSFGVMKVFFNDLIETIPDDISKNKLIELSHEILFRAWMFDEVFNGDWDVGTDAKLWSNRPLWPLVVIYLFGEPFFINVSYCSASWLSVTEIVTHARMNDLYDYVYVHDDAERTKKQVLSLKAGKWYRNFWISMKHSHRRILWNSFGGIWERIEVRIGRDVTNIEDIKDESRGHFSGNTMYSVEILGGIYDILVESGKLSSEYEYRLTWMAEYLSLFDFVWNHGGFLTECIFLPKESPKGASHGEIKGVYNGVYARFFEKSFRKEENFSKIFSIAHHETDITIPLRGMIDEGSSLREEVFYSSDKKPTIEVLWNSFVCPHDCFAERSIFSIGLPMRFVRRGGFFRKIWNSLSFRPKV